MFYVRVPLATRQFLRVVPAALGQRKTKVRYQEDNKHCDNNHIEYGITNNNKYDGGGECTNNSSKPDDPNPPTTSILYRPPNNNKYMGLPKVDKTLPTSSR